jgi:thiol-disulfide isomerase/thioredoxin
MKRLLLTGVLCVLGSFLFAKDGYKIEIKFKQDMPDEYVYLAHYYAKPLPTIYKTDSAKVINKRTAVIDSRDSVLGGIYMILFADRSKYVEFVLDNGSNMEIAIDTVNMPANITFKNSPENSRYVAYEQYQMEYGKKQMALNEGIKAAKTAADTAAVRNKSKLLLKDLTTYRQDYAKKYQGTYLSNVFNALKVPDVPEGTFYLEDKKTVDSNYAYRYYKQHYWDDFSFNDNRIMYSPIYDGKLDEYFNRLVVPLPDSVNAESDALLARTRKSKELFKYTLHWLARNAESSKVMGMDEVFVHLVEKYYMKGDAYWLDSASLAKYEDRAKKIAPNVLGNIAPDLELQDIHTLKDISLHAVQAKYTMVVFWSRECGHCMSEVPKIDSLYDAVLKQRGVKVYAVSTEGELSEIQKTVDKLTIGDWINVVDANNKKDYRSKYDVYSTPKVYLLDEQKKIIGKGLDHSNIIEVLDWTEKKNKKKS